MTTRLSDVKGLDFFMWHLNQFFLDKIIIFYKKYLRGILRFFNQIIYLFKIIINIFLFQKCFKLRLMNLFDVFFIKKYPDVKGIQSRVNSCINLF